MKNSYYFLMEYNPTYKNTKNYKKIEIYETQVTVTCKINCNGTILIY